MTKRKHNKSAFVRSLSTNLTAAEVVEKGKAAGIKLTEKQVYVIRSLARKKETATNGKLATANFASAAKHAPKAAVSTVKGRKRAPIAPITQLSSLGALDSEVTFKLAVMRIGLDRARVVLDSLETTV